MATSMAHRPVDAPASSWHPRSMSPSTKPRAATTPKHRPRRHPRRRLVAEGPRFASVDERALLLRQLAGGITDKLRNMIMIVPLSTDYLRWRLKRAIQRDPEIGDALAALDDTAHRVVAFADRLYDHAARNWRDVSLFRARDVIESAVGKFRRANSEIDIELGLRCGDAVVVVNYDCVAAALSHVLANAAMELERCEAKKPWIRVTARVVGRGGDSPARLRVTIEDNGRGIREEVFEILFQPYAHTPDLRGATGLGLASTNEIVQRYGGSIRAENRTEGGARFVIELPVARG